MTLFQGFGFWSSSLSGAAPGMVLLTPTSITHSGTSASVGANGQVTFTAVTSLSLNGVFSADFDNYVVSFNSTISVSTTIFYRMRLSGTDNTTASSYVSQVLYGSGTTVGAARDTNDYGSFYYSNTGGQNGCTQYVYGPNLAQPTATRSVAQNVAGGIYIEDYATTHNQSTAYDGITYWVGGGGFSGALQVYGVRS
jgi:hypothetical protein